jgi:hypothetical protein
MVLFLDGEGANSSEFLKSGYLVTFLAALLFCLPILEVEGRAQHDIALKRAR